MAKLKIKNNIWHIIYNCIKLYCLNILPFTKYMLFPIFGQILGIVLIFSLTWWFSYNLPSIAENHTLFNNFATIVITLLIIIIPGFVIFLKAFWDFLVAYGALNSMTQAVISTGKLYDFKAHNEVVTKRSFKFVGLLGIITILSFIAINPLFWVLGLIFFIYFILVFQVFTFEEDRSIIDCFKKSFNLIKGNFGRTFFLVVILVSITYYTLPCIADKLLEITKLEEFFKGILETWSMTLPLEKLNDFTSGYKLPQITALDVAEQVLNSTVSFCIIGLTLPMRSLCWTLWYKNLSERK